MGEKLAAVLTVEHLKERACQGDGEAFYRLLEKGHGREPLDWDRSEGNEDACIETLLFVRFVELWKKPSRRLAGRAGSGASSFGR